MIIRRKVNQYYTVIRNEALNDDRLSFAALGLLCYLRGRPHNWSVQLEQLRKREGCGRERMQALMRELISTGWVLRQESRKSGRGTFAGIEYVVLDEPQQPASDDGSSNDPEPPPESENPTAAPESGLPESGKPESENPTPYKVRTLQNTDSSEPDGSGAQPAPQAKKLLFSEGRPALIALGVSEREAGKVIGRWLRDTGDDHPRVLAAILAARERCVHAPIAWITAHLHPEAPVEPRRGAGQPRDTPIAPAVVAERRAEASRMAARGEWPIGGDVFVQADSPAGQAWEAHFAGLGTKARWRQCPKGWGGYLPTRAPPEASTIVADGRSIR